MPAGRDLAQADCWALPSKGTAMDFTSEHHLDGGVVERTFTLGEIPGILWTPAVRTGPADPGRASRRAAQDVPPTGGAGRMPRRTGFASVAIELPGSGDRPRSAAADQARADLRRALAAGEPVDDIVDAWSSRWSTRRSGMAGHAGRVLSLPEIGGRVGFSGGVIAIGIRLAVVEPRIAAALLFAGSFVPRAMFEEARRVTIPLHVLLQWDDEGNDRQMALDLFDAFGSKEKTLHANMGGHTGVPAFEADASAGFFERHLT